MHCCLKGTVSPILSVTLKSQKHICMDVNVKKNGSVFLNNHLTNAQKLVSFIFGCGWLGWKWIGTLKNMSNVLQVPFKYFFFLKKKNCFKLIIVNSFSEKSFHIFLRVLYA